MDVTILGGGGGGCGGGGGLGWVGVWYQTGYSYK